MAVELKSGKKEGYFSIELHSPGRFYRGDDNLLKIAYQLKCVP